VICGIPTPLPLTPSTARRIFHGGYAHPRGLGVNMATGSPWSINLSLPSATEALALWAADYGYHTSEPPSGKDARALLSRLGRLSRLDSLIDEPQLEILVKLHHSPASSSRGGSHASSRLTGLSIGLPRSYETSFATRGSSSLSTVSLSSSSRASCLEGP